MPRDYPGATGINAATRKAARDVPNVARERQMFLSPRLLIVAVVYSRTCIPGTRSSFVGYFITSAST